MRRRDLLSSFATYAGVIAVVPFSEDMRDIRLRAQSLLETQSVTAATVEWWEQAVNTYGYKLFATPPQDLLGPLLASFSEVHGILSRRQPLRFQRRLYGVLAKFAGYTGIALGDMSDSPEVYHWFHTANLAASEAEDENLRAWLAAYEANSYLWYERPHTTARTLALKAQRIGSRKEGSVSFILGKLMEANAWALAGDGPATLAACQRAEAGFELLGPAETDGNALGVYEHLLRFYQSRSLTMVREVDYARVAQREALRLCGTDLIGATVTRFDQVACLIYENEVEEACRMATEILFALPTNLRQGQPIERAREVAKIIKPRDERLPVVRDFRDIVRTIATQPDSV